MVRFLRVSPSRLGSPQGHGFQHHSAVLLVLAELGWSSWGVPSHCPALSECTLVPPLMLSLMRWRLTRLAEARRIGRPSIIRALTEA